VQVRVDELLRVELGEIDVLVRGEVEDDVGPRQTELLLEPAGVA
jgi:hypothetical protein